MHSSPDRHLDLPEWIRQGKSLGTIGRGAAWWIGDWVNYGSAKFGEKYARAARITGYDIQSLMNMAYVAARFHISRRRENLSWSHHAEVAAAIPDPKTKQPAPRSRAVKSASGWAKPGFSGRP